MTSVVAGPVGQDRDVRRAFGDRRGRPGRPAAIPDVIGIIPADHAGIALRGRLAGSRRRWGSRALGGGRRGWPIAGTIERRAVRQELGVVQHEGEGPRMGGGAFGGSVGEGPMHVGVLAQAEAQLLEVEDAAELAPLELAPIHGGDERQQAGEEDAGGHRDVGPAKGDDDRQVIRQGPATSATLGDETDGPPGQSGRRLDGIEAVVQQSFDRPAEPVDPLGQGGVLRDLSLGEFARRAVELAEDIIQHSLASSWHQPLPSRGATRAICCSLARAAWSRDLTVPTGIFKISAISRYFRS